MAIDEPRLGHKDVGAGPAGQSIRSRVLALVGALLWSVIATEFGFRLFVDVTDVPFYFGDPVIGPRRAPNQTGRYIRGAVNAEYHFNDLGWNHSRSYSVESSPGVRRIAIVGDSYVEALQVNPDQTMFTVAEQQMNRPERPVQWLAFGNSGWGTTQEYEVIRHYVLDYRPDVVVLLFVDNDPWDSSPYLMPIEPYYVTYELTEAGGLLRRPPRPWAPNKWRRLAARSAVARYFTVQHSLFSSPQRPMATTAAPLREGAAQSASSEARGEMTLAQRHQKTWQLIEKVLEAARDECDRRGAQLVVAFRGWEPEIEAPLTGTPYVAPPKEEDPLCLDVRAGEMGREFVGPISARLGIPYLDLTSALRDLVARTGRSHVFPGDSHYNAEAHATAGAALATWIESLWAQQESR